MGKIFPILTLLSSCAWLGGCGASGPALTGLQGEQKTISAISDSLGSLEAFETSLQDNANYSRQVYLRLYPQNQSSQDACFKAISREDDLIGKRAKIVSGIGDVLNLAIADFPDSSKPDSTSAGFDTISKLNTVLSDIAAASIASKELGDVIAITRAAVAYGRTQAAKANARKILTDPKNIKAIRIAIDALGVSLRSVDRSMNVNFNTWAMCERLRFDRTLRNLQFNGMGDIEFANNWDAFLRQEAAAQIGLKKFGSVPVDLQKSLSQVPDQLQKLANGGLTADDINAALSLADTILKSGQDLNKAINGS
jgi:hypothetical protein